MLNVLSREMFAPAGVTAVLAERYEGIPYTEGVADTPRRWLKKDEIYLVL